MLNWRTDPLLVDSKSVPWQQWHTANNLLAESPDSWIPGLFLRDFALNFYGIMVRKSDFVKKSSRDRLQTRFPYLCLSPRLQALIESKNSRLAANLSHYYQQAESFRPRAWRKKLQRYLRQGHVPLPFFRVFAHLQLNENEFLIEHFTGATLESFRHEPFRFPVEMTEPLAYFLGVVAGDGTLTPHQVKIVDCHEDYMRRLHALAIKITGTTPLLFPEGAANAWRLIVKSKWYARLIHFLSGQPFGKKYEALRVPRIFRVQWYPCPHCDYKAKQKDNLTRHLVDKHDIGAQWYPCPQCDYKAKQKSNLIRHLANKHDTGPVFKHLADISGTTFVGSNFQIGES